MSCEQVSERRWALTIESQAQTEPRPENQAGANALPAADVKVVAIKRGAGPRAGCGAPTSTSCDDLGWLEFSVKLPAPAAGAEAADSLGIKMEAVAGVLPEGLTLPSTPIVASPSFQLTWIDGANDTQEPLRFTIRFWLVSRAGDLSESIDVTIGHGSSSGDVSATRGPEGTSMPWPLMVALLLTPVLARRWPDVPWPI